MQTDLIFFLPKEKINTQSLRQTSVQWWWWGGVCRAGPVVQEGKERKRKGKMTSGIDLAWVEAKAKTVRGEAPLRLLVDL